MGGQNINGAAPEFINQVFLVRLRIERIERCGPAVRVADKSG